MILRCFWDILFFLLSLIVFTIYPFGLHTNNSGDETARIHIVNNGSSFTLYRDRQPFKINGASGNGPLEPLSALGANTIRVYDTVDLLRTLDEAEAFGLAVIVDIPILPYDPDFNYYWNKEENDKLQEEVRQLVRRYRSHPALLFWNLGNELNYPRTLTGNDFTRSFNKLVEIIKMEDPDHPVGTVITFPSRKELLSIAWHSPELDVIGFNVFGNIKNIEKSLESIDYFLTPFPYYVSEWSHDGPWETISTNWASPIELTSTKKMEQLRQRHQLLEDQGKGSSLGALAFFWGSKLEATPTWFSTFFKDSLRSETLRTLESLWKQDGVMDKPIGLNYMLLDEYGAPSSLIFSPGEQKNARLVFHDNPVDNLRIHWEIHRESWDRRSWGEVGQVIEVNAYLLGSIGNAISIRVPQEEGPYRLFAFACDTTGYCATSNIPFYVLKNPNGR